MVLRVGPPGLRPEGRGAHVALGFERHADPRADLAQVGARPRARLPLPGPHQGRCHVRARGRPLVRRRRQ
eukprot:9823103-Alexandrium_andersonii.AAC.1